MAVHTEMLLLWKQRETGEYFVILILIQVNSYIYKYRHCMVYFSLVLITALRNQCLGLFLFSLVYSTSYLSLKNVGPNLNYF